MTETITDFKEWAKNATVKEIEDYTDTFKEGDEFDYTNQYWGHAFSCTQEYGTYIKYGYGFHRNSRRIDVGSVLLLKTQSGRIGRYVVLNIEHEWNPKDMFWAYVVCIGHKEG